jgi:hypothetical protein
MQSGNGSGLPSSVQVRDREGEDVVRIVARKLNGNVPGTVDHQDLSPSDDIQKKTPSPGGIGGS